VLASRLAPDTVNNFYSDIARAFLTLFLSASIFASGASAQEFRETLLSTDNAYNPIPSPDGRYIAYVRTGWGEKSWVGFGRASLVSDVKIVNTEGAPTSKTLAQDYFLSGWAPDSAHLLCFRDGRYALVSIDEKADTNGKIPNDQKLHPFSEWVAYLPTLATIVWNRQVDRSYRVIETQDQTIVKEKGFLGARVVPSPDGRYLAVYSESSKTNLRVYDINSQAWKDLGEVSIHPDTNWLYIQPNWSPWFADGSRLVFLRGSSIVISSPDGIQQSEIKVDGSAGLPVPSPDGKSVAYVTYEPRPMNNRPDLQFWGETTILVISVAEGSRPRRLTEKNPDEVLDLKWLGNETLVFDRVADELFYKQARIWKVSVPR
jgi:Tol biopolymer transport system component